MKRPAGNNAPSKATRVATEDGADFFVYVYGIVEAGTEAHRLLLARTVPGMTPGHPLFAVEEDGLVAAVCFVRASEFQEDQLNGLLSDIPRVTPIALKHHEAINALMPAAPAMAPMSLGTVFVTQDRVRDLLVTRASELRGILDNLRGKAEWGVKVYGDTPSLVLVAEANSAALRTLAERLKTETPGKAYLTRKQRDHTLAAEVERLAKDTVNTIGQRLANECDDMFIDQLPDQKNASSRLYLKVALLLPANKSPRLQEVVAGLRAEFELRGFAIEADGPWAPYSFVAERHATR